MASAVEDRTGSSTALDAGTTAGRVVDEKFGEPTLHATQDVMAADEDVAGDLRKLSEDVAKIKDTVAEIARNLTPPARHLTREIAVVLRQKIVIARMFALLGAVLLLLSLIFGIEALHEWLKSHYGSLPAFIILCSAWATVGAVFLGVALLLSGRGRP
jgi:hypothetical protein